MDTILSPKFIQKMFLGGKYTFVAAIFLVTLDFFDYFIIPSGFLTIIYIYLLLNGTAAGAIIYRGHQVFVTEKYCPKCNGTLELKQEYKCPNCGSLTFEK